MSEDRFSKSRLIFGDDFEILRNSNVILFGVGGVGGFCLDTLYRSGVGGITIVDFDVFDTTNQNRQIGSERIGEQKVKVMRELYRGLHVIKTKITPNWVCNFDFGSYDLVIDAIDDMDAKTALALACNRKLISSMGGAKKLDPTMIKIDSWQKTYGDALARKYRHALKKANLKRKFDVVFSPEEAKCDGLGSFSGVTGSFGLALGSLAIAKLTHKKIGKK